MMPWSHTVSSKKKENPMENDDDPACQFNLMSMLLEFEAPNGEELVLIVTQVENSTNKTITIKVTKTSATNYIHQLHIWQHRNCK